MSRLDPVVAGNGRPARPPASTRAAPDLLRARAADGAVGVEFPADRRFHAAARLVAGGVATRIGLDVDEIGDLRLAIDAALLERPAGPTLRLTMTESDDGACELELGPFVAGDDRSALARVLRALVDGVHLHEAGHGEWIAVKVERQLRDPR